MKKEKKEVTGFRLIFGYLGVFLILVGFLTVSPLIIVIFYPEERDAVLPFASTAGVDVVIGLLFYFLFLFKRKRAKFRRHEESALLTLIWVFAILSGAMPFYLAKDHLQLMNFSKSIFESASSYTGTGLTGFLDYIDVAGAFAPHVFTYHRSQMQFIGGVGLVLLVASILGANAGVKLYVSEGHSDKLLPNIAKSAKLIFGIYAFYSFLGSVALYFAGLPWFEAVCTSMCALSGGGMSVRSYNIGSYRAFEGMKLEGCVFPVSSLSVEIIVMVLVVFGMISFVLHTFILRGKFKTFFKDCETKYIAATGLIGLTISFFGALTTISRVTGNAFFDESGPIFRDVIFYVVGSFTTSGFALSGPNSTYALIGSETAVSLGKPLLYVCTLLMIVGAGSGSTGGGIKQFRMVVALKELSYSIRYKFAPARQLYPHTIYRYGEVKDLDSETGKEANNYILLYLGVFLVSVTLLCFHHNYDAELAAFDVASAMGNVGLGLVDYTPLPEGLDFLPLWVLSFDMLLGRLEIMPLAYTASNVKEEVSFYFENRRKNKAEAAVSAE